MATNVDFYIYIEREIVREYYGRFVHSRGKLVNISLNFNIKDFIF